MYIHTLKKPYVIGLKPNTKQARIPKELRKPKIKQNLPPYTQNNLKHSKTTCDNR